MWQAEPQRASSLVFFCWAPQDQLSLSGHLTGAWGRGRSPLPLPPLLPHHIGPFWSKEKVDDGVGEGGERGSPVTQSWCLFSLLDRPFRCLQSQTSAGRREEGKSELQALWAINWLVLLLPHAGLPGQSCWSGPQPPHLSSSAGLSLPLRVP